MPLVIGVGLLAVMMIWKRGRFILAAYHARAPAMSGFPDIVERRLVARVPGCAVFLVSQSTSVPPIRLHHVARIRQIIAHHGFMEQAACRRCLRMRSSITSCRST